MSIEQIAFMKRNGMHIGSHGYDHCWLASLPKKKQEYEIDKSLEFIRKIGGEINAWTMCYPYGNYNSDTISILKRKGCKLGLTTRIDITDIMEDNRFELPRIDTIYIPNQRNADLNEWVS
jgi:peptidoglycan/xylan/chitin deacetylase (PgdA/CDA1 family)